jgi:uncharacterized protein YutE (UPF0331/DUF86 family)
MVDRETLDRRLAKLEELLRRLRQLSALDRDAYLASVALQAQAERWLHLASECCIDLAHHLIAEHGWRTPNTYREAFEVLAAEGVLSAELARSMAAWAGLRNVLVHLYLDVDHDAVFGFLKQDLGQLEQFAASVLRAADEQ